MKLSESWLREWVSPEVETNALVEQLTMAGLEVDGVEPAAAMFSGVVVGEICAIEQHPDADKLRVCQVAGNGDELTQVVCGASNAREGIKIPFATVGAKLAGDFKIKKAKLRGVESFGMLCAEEELGLADKSDGLWELPADAPIGADVRDYLQLNDTIIEVDLTPNRGDCLSVRGVAREVGVLNKVAVQVPEMPAVAAVIEDVLPVSLKAEAACPQYAGRVIKNINSDAETPLWMVEKLRRSGIRSIGPVVDVTNYVLLELGQPMHAFDLATLDGGIQVRMAEEGENLSLLDGSDVDLTADTLVIADNAKAVAMAGVMGGADTAVTDNTRDIFLESAYFDRVVIAGKARNYGKHTDSSHRFERGVDPAIQSLAIERATALLLDIVGGEPGPVTVEQLNDDVFSGKAPVLLKRDTIARQLSIDIADEAVVSMMALLGCELEETLAEGWRFSVPSWRFDIEIEADLIEEVARIYGYNNIPSEVIDASLTIQPKSEVSTPLSVLRETLMTRGYQEAITYSFVDPTIQLLLMPEEPAVALTNPIASDMSVMRTSLWSGLIPALRNNVNRQQPRVRLFETGQRFVERDGQLVQDDVIAGVIYGSRQQENWTQKAEKIDFYDLKGDVEALLGRNSKQASNSIEGEGYKFVADSIPALHPGQSARLEKNGQLVGYLGKLHPSLNKALDVQDVYLFELSLAVLSQKTVPEFEEVSRFPEISWDLAFIVDETVVVGDLLTSVQQNAGENLVDLKVFDVYQGKGVENHRKSVALGLTFQHRSRTLEEDEITQSVNNVVAKLESQFSANLRGEL